MNRNTGKNTLYVALYVMATAYLLAKDIRLSHVAPSCYVFDLALIPCVLITVFYGKEKGLAFWSFKCAMAVFFKTPGMPAYAHLVTSICDCWMELTGIILLPMFMQEHMKVKSKLRLGIVAAVLGQAIAGAALGGTILLKFYAFAFGLTEMEFIETVASQFPAVTGMWDLTWKCLLPFYLFKGLMVIVLSIPFMHAGFKLKESREMDRQLRFFVRCR